MQTGTQTVTNTRGLNKKKGKIKHPCTLSYTEKFSTRENKSIIMQNPTNQNTKHILSIDLKLLYINILPPKIVVILDISKKHEIKSHLAIHLTDMLNTNYLCSF